nr:hypothetical protein [Rhizobium leguminosarum]
MLSIRGIFIAYGWGEHSITPFKSRCHLLDYLTLILGPFKLSRRREHRLYELSLRGVFQFQVQAHDFRTARPKLAAKPPVKLGVAGKSLEIIENDDVALPRLGIEVTQECHNARTFHEITATRDVIGENSYYLQVVLVGKLAATVLLAL